MNTQELNALSAGENESTASPMEILLQITLALIPVLAIAVVTLNAIQTDALDALQSGLRKYDVNDMHELVIEIERQKLIARVDQVLQGYEQQLCLGAFSLGGAGDEQAVEQFAVDDAGYPRDPRFRKLCSASHELFADAKIADIVVAAYVQALEIDDDGETLYDVQHRPYPSKDDAVSVVSPANRDYAIARIHERVGEFRDRARNAQAYAVDSVLIRGADESIVADDEHVIQQNLRDSFASRGLQLLPGLFDD